MSEEHLGLSLCFLKRSWLSCFWFFVCLFSLLLSIWVTKLMSSVFHVSSFPPSRLLVCGYFCMLSCFRLPKTEYWCVCAMVCGVTRVWVSWLVSISWFLRLLLHSLILRSWSLVVTDLGSSSSCLLPSLSFLWCNLSPRSAVPIFRELFFVMPLIFYKYIQYLLLPQ